MPYDVLGVARHLRAIGVPVSTQEILDSYTAVGLLGSHLAGTALAITLVKDEAARRALAGVEALFADHARAEPVDGEDDSVARHLRELTDDELAAIIRGALSRNDQHAISAAATELVDRHVTIQPAAPVAGNVHVLRAYRAARPDQLRAALCDEFVPSHHDPLASLRRRLWDEEVDRRLERLRQAIEAVVRHRLVLDRGAASVARAIRDGLPGDVDFLRASAAELRQLSSTLETLPSRLERRLKLAEAPVPARRLDVRATIRSSMATGGVPARPVFLPGRPPRPELIVLADISGSVASFARFTLSLAHALHARFHTVRSFVFIDGIDEITQLMGQGADVLRTAERIDADQLGVHLDGHSDYGRALTQFWATYGHQLNPRTIVVILGDARGNFRDPGEGSLQAMARRAGRLYWLNPERKATWQDGDCEIETYRPHCSGVFEVRTVRQLEEFVVSHTA